MRTQEEMELSVIGPQTDGIDIVIFYGTIGYLGRQRAPSEESRNQITHPASLPAHL